MFDAAKAIIVPFPTSPIKVVVSSVVADGQGKTTVAWSDGYPATLFAPAHLALELFADLPDSIDGIPLLVPTVGTPLRNQIDNWLESSGRSPTIIAEIDDSALLKTSAAAGHACFFAPTIIKVEIGARYHVLPIIEIPQITESVYAITLDRRTDHPAVAQIINSSSSILDR